MTTGTVNLMALIEHSRPDLVTRLAGPAEPSNVLRVDAATLAKVLLTELHAMPLKGKGQERGSFS
jgi:hypothetical protein